MNNIKFEVINEDWKWCWYVDKFLMFKWDSRAVVEAALGKFKKEFKPYLYVEKNSKTYFKDYFLNSNIIENEDPNSKSTKVKD